MDTWTVCLPRGPGGIASDSDTEMIQQDCLGEYLSNDTPDSCEHVEVACDNVCAPPGG